MPDQPTPTGARINHRRFSRILSFHCGVALILFSLLAACAPPDTPTAVADLGDSLRPPAAEARTAPDTGNDAGYAATPAVAWRPGPPADLETIGAGECLWRRGEELIPLPMLATAAELEVTGLLVHGTLRQTFANPGDAVIEAVYVFPLPERAAVNALTLRIGERLIEAELHEKAEARRVYTRARDEGRKAALLESERPNLFTTSVANINPGERVEVTLEYIQEADWNAGAFSLAFPLTFTPRFTPPPRVAGDGDMPASVGGTPADTARVFPPPRMAGDGGVPPAAVAALADAARVTPPFLQNGGAPAPTARLAVRLDPGVPLARVECPSHPMRMEHDERRWTITPAAGELAADRDFLLTWRPEPAADPAPAVFLEEREGKRYALLMLLPPAEADSTAALPASTLFMVDISGSMDGPSIAQARRALLAALDRLGPDDAFNLLAFNDGSDALAEGFLDATPDNIRRGRDWVAALEARGGTMIHPAMERALRLSRPATDDTRVRRLLLLTDAAVSNEAAVLNLLARDLGDARLHVVGIGHAPNRHLMRKMASFGHGLCAFVAGDGEVEGAMDDLLRRVSRPAMSHLRLDWRGVATADVHPARLPDLHAGEPLFVSALLLGETDEEAEVTLTGRLPRGEAHTRLSLARNAAAGSGVATRWARARVGSLMDSLHEGADPERVRAAVIATAQPFNLVTQYTSLVAVEQTPTAVGPARTARVPNALPRGSRLGGLPSGGTSRPLRTLIGGLLCALGLLPLVLRRIGGAA